MAKTINADVPLTDVYFDSELYPRTGTYWQTYFVYSQAMKSGARFPPIVLALYKGKKYLVDGKHRLEACKLLKKTSIPAIIHIGWDKKRIFEESIKLNIAHGVSLSPYEKRRIALKLRAMKYGNIAISEILQVPQDKLENFVGQRLVNSITGNTIVKSSMKHFAGQTVGQEQMEIIETSQEESSSKGQIDLLKQVVELAENDLFDLSDGKVLELIDKLKGLLKKY